MDIKKTLVAGSAVLVLIGSVGGAALASSKHAAPAKPATSETTTAPDTDNVQQGDQTTPDTTGTSSEATGETSGESSGEGAPSDGPGGHADPAGNVDHQFDGQE
ncbi:MAG: hypothetical protein ABI828_06135 [Actinomycetota bacterium]